MIKKLLLFLCLFVSVGAVCAQGTEVVPLPKGLQSYKPREDGKERKISFFTGGSFQFGVGGNSLQLKISPHFGIYPAVEWLRFGVGGTYELLYYKDYYSGLKSYYHVFGARGFVEGLIWKQRIIVHAEYEWLSYPDVDNDGIREQSHALLVGPGYQQAIGDKFFPYVLLLFPVYEPDSNPVNAYSVCEFRVGLHYKF